MSASTRRTGFEVAAMDRRNTILTLAALCTAARGAVAQQAGRTPRIGILGVGPPELMRQSLLELGWVDGQNVIIESRDVGGQVERFDAFAAELVRLKVDVIVAPVPAAAFAAKRATASIPIVLMNTPDPVQLGLVASLARPGGNITGTSTLSADLSVKQLDLLKEAAPKAQRIAVLWNPGNPWHPLALRGLEPAARPLGLQLLLLGVRSTDEIGAAFAAMAAKQAEAVLVLADPLSFAYRQRVVELAASRRLPAMYGLRPFVDAGGLMSYWAHQADLYRRAASYVDRILKGAKPGALPIEQPARYELVINLRTAHTLGLAIPRSLLGRADEVIQ
jgi:putative ABC transport system substrate-binding protein